MTDGKKVPVQDLGGGVTRKIMSYSENVMLVDLTFEEGGEGAFHQHPHEQISYLVSGSIEYEIKGVEKVILHPGDSIYVAPNKEHGCRALEKSRLLDIFTPVRKDFF